MMSDYSSPFEAAQNITWRRMKAGLVLLNLDSGEYYTLNDTATTIWEGILGGKDEQAIVEDLLAAYDCERTEAEKDTRHHIEFLIKEKLVTHKTAIPS